MAGIEIPNGSTAVDNVAKPMPGADTDSSERLSQNMFAERVEMAQQTPGKDTVEAPAETDPLEKQTHPDPLKEFWANRDQSIARLVPELTSLDDSWKPFYDEIVKSEGYSLNLKFQKNTNDIYNHVHVLTPEGERDALWNNMIRYVRGEEGAEEALSGDPRALELAKEMKGIIRNPNFQAFQDIAEAVTPLVEYSAQGRDILSEESVKQGEIAAGLQLSMEATQLRNFIKSMARKGDLKILLNDSSTRA